MSTPTQLPTPTAPLSPAASAALYRLMLSVTPPLMEFASVSGTSVTVHAVDDSSAPYRWTCTAGHSGGHHYGSLPFCRDDAKAHAAECKGFPGVASDYRAAEARANELIWSALTTGIMSDLDADDLAHNVDLMAGYKATLADSGHLDLIGGA
jgi:hypothetical protein